MGHLCDAVAGFWTTIWPLTAIRFFEGFWPNFIATALGILIGIPAALWVNRYAVKAAEAAQRNTEKQRLQQALDVVSRAIKGNKALVDQVVAMLPSGYVWGLPLDLSAWEVTQGEIIPYLRDASVQQRLAYHFSQLNLLVKQVDLHTSYHIGVTSALSNAAQIRTAIGPQIVAMANRLSGEASQLVADIDKIRAELSQ